jgi:hypothetical protein
MQRKFNALKTGAYAREVVLPWESPEEFEKLRANIFAAFQPADEVEASTAFAIAENRFIRARLRCTTAIATHRHPFGRALEDSGARSWGEAAAVAVKRQEQFQQMVEDIACSTNKLANVAEELVASPESERQAKAMLKKIAVKIKVNSEVLAGIAAHLDDEKNFFAHYFQKHLERRIQLENALDAQLDKLLARMQRLKEARILRDKSRPSPETSVGNSPAPSPEKHGQQIDPASVANLPGGEDDRGIDDLTVDDLADETDSPDEDDAWDSKE